MARTKGKPGPKPKYGEREEIHVLVPIDDLNYIRSVTNNVTEWVIQAIQAKRQHEVRAPHEVPSPKPGRIRSGVVRTEVDMAALILERSKSNELELYGVLNDLDSLFSNKLPETDDKDK